MKKRFLGVLALAALLGPLAGWAQQTASPAQPAGASCDFKDRLTFADGKAACLSDYTLGQQRPVGYSSTVRDLLLHIGRYAVATTVGAPTCPMVLTLAQDANNNGPAVSGPRRDLTAMADCRTALSRVNAKADCQCEVVILDGTVSGRKDDFDQRFLRNELRPPQVALASPPAAQTCDAKDRLSFVEGKSACITEYSLSPLTPYGYNRALEQMLPANGIFALASTALPGGACPLMVGLTLESGGNLPMMQDPGNIARRSSAALAACESGLSRVNASRACMCQVVAVDGRSTLPKEEFDKRYWPDERRQAESARITAAILAATETPATPASPTAGTVDPAPNRDELLASLQKRLAELEAERRAPVAGATALPSVPRLSARALVIGNGRYSSFGVLANPGRDARAIAAKFRSFGIEVDLVLDAQRDDIIHALNEHSRKAAGKDVSILFYAGHGVQVEGTNYLIPVNMRADGISSGYVKLAGISLNAALDYLPAKTRLVFLDACRDNPATRSLVATRSGATAGLAPVNAASGTLLSYATRDGATADDGDGQNSPYTTALLRHLDTPSDISLVLRQVRQTVLQLTGGRQEPWEYGSLVGEQIVLPLLAR